MDLDEAVEWWYEDGSYLITAAAVTLRGGIGDWADDTLPPDCSAAAREIQAEARSAAAVLVASAERFETPVAHGTGVDWGLAVGAQFEVPLMSTGTDADTVAYFASSRSEDGAGRVLEFPGGAVGVRVNATEWVITGNYQVDDVYVGSDGLEHTVLRPA